MSLDLEDKETKSNRCEKYMYGTRFTCESNPGKFNWIKSKVGKVYSYRWKWDVITDVRSEVWLRQTVCRLKSSALCTGLFSLCMAWRTLIATSSGSRSSTEDFLFADSGLSTPLLGPYAENTHFLSSNNHVEWNISATFSFKNGRWVCKTWLTLTFPALFWRWPI